MSKKLLLKKHMIDFSFLVYIVVVLYGVFSPRYGLQTNYLRLNIIPFNWIWILITGYYTNIVTVYRSIIISFVLLMPLGFLLPFVFNNVRSLRHVVIISFTTSLLIEITQLVLPRLGRSFDVDDIILNTIGAVIGYLLSVLVVRLVHKERDIKIAD